jgi:DNA repair exonuclease SbcCD nuclease subunit
MKLTQALEIFAEKKCDCVLQVGDFFDSPTVANKVKAAIIELLHCFGFGRVRRFFCVFGQHDVSGHSKYTLPNSPLAVLQAARVIKILDDNPVLVGEEDDTTCIYGASFGEYIIEPHEDCYNILVTHRMVGDRPLWPGQELVGPRQFLRKHPGYNLIVCGDYHFRFTETWNGRTIINPGAIVRKTISKFDLEHKPAVVIFDTNTSELEIVELSVQPPEKVFDLTRIVKKQDNSILADLVEKLKSGEKKLSGWKHFLGKVFKIRKSNERSRQIIDECLEEINNG